MCLHVCALARVVEHVLLGITFPLALVWTTMTALLEVLKFTVRALKHMRKFQFFMGEYKIYLTHQEAQFKTFGVLGGVWELLPQ